MKLDVKSTSVITASNKGHLSHSELAGFSWSTSPTSDHHSISIKQESKESNELLTGTLRTLGLGIALQTQSSNLQSIYTETLDPTQKPSIDILSNETKMGTLAILAPESPVQQQIPNESPTLCSIETPSLARITRYSS
jgi:hypothetical protein